jgi:electron transport complex protein RnfC
VTPYGKEPLDLGVWVLNASDLIDLGCSSPVISRVVTVAGTALARPGNYRVPLGTSYADILRPVGLTESIGSVVDGGPMTGRAIPSLDCVITQETRAVLAIERADVLIKRPGPCIRCGWCLDDCPVQLDPRAILNVVECEDWARGQGLFPRACLECGLCSYICPSELPLAEAARKLKRREEGIENTGDRSQETE